LKFLKNIHRPAKWKKTIPDGTFQQYRSGKSIKIKRFCSGPFVSMRIGIDGSVYACNHNSQQVLGKYPEQTLMQIWQGKPIQELRDHLANHDFSLGCSLCEDDILQGRFAQGSFVMFDRFPEQYMPSMLDFRLSNACNLKCIMCSGLSSSSFGHRSKEQTVQFDASFLKQLEDFIPHLHTARFIGGEPLAIPIYYEIWEMIIDLNPACNIVIQTNGTILNDRVKFLSEKGKVHFSISIDSLEPEAYQQIRVGAVLDKVLPNIQFFADNARLKNRDLVLCFCPMRLNYKELPSFLHYANQHDALVCLNRFLYPANLAIWSLPSKEIEVIRTYLATVDYTPIKPHEQQNHQYYLDYLSLLDEWIVEARIRENSEPTTMEQQQLFSKFRLGANTSPALLEMTAILEYPDQGALYFYLKPLLHAYSLKTFFDFLDTADVEKIHDDLKSVSH
jgi:MoaA/NifB/PqqE/SkfB family radical SAM enzyme